MEPIDRQEVEAFVGRNAAYYLKRWGLPPIRETGYDQDVPDIQLPQPKTGFNWAAFFLSGLWLPYRKMYVPTLIFFGFILVETVLEEILFVGILRKPEPPPALGQMVGLIAAAVCGSCGNQWYLSHARKAIADVRSQDLPEEEHLHLLSQRGGTNMLAAIGFFVMFIAAIFVVMVGLDSFLVGE
jgi:Protein of unknown function (DUF2628)